MEIRIIGRGAPVINQAIAYESGRDRWLDLLNNAAGRPVAPDGPEIFSRTLQSTVGIGYLLDRFLQPVPPELQAGEPDREPAGAAS